MVRRWQQLPLDRALSALPAVSTLVQRLADEVCDARGMPRASVPDLGPEVVMDQMVVMVYDALQAGLPPGSVLEGLTAVRRGLP